MTVVVSLLAPDWASLWGLGPEVCQGADLVEVRLDNLPTRAEPDAADGDGTQVMGCDLKAWIARQSLPVLVSMHGTEGLGSLIGDRAAHVQRLKQAAADGAAWVDVDYSLAADLVPKDLLARRIVSRHVSNPDSDWRAAYTELCAAALPGDRIKFVVQVRSAEGGLEVLNWVENQPLWPGGRSAFCMGEAGVCTRFLAMSQPDGWVYCAANPGRGSQALQPAAAGQISLQDWQRLGFPRGTEPGWQGVIGNPIGHSLSPGLHSQALRDAGLRAGFLALQASDLPSLLRAAQPWNFQGFAVTAPFKEVALGCAQSADPAALAIGAANTLVRLSGAQGPGPKEQDSKTEDPNPSSPTEYRAHNTDWIGVRDALLEPWPAFATAHGLGADPAGESALVLGAGGAARAALYALLEMGLPCSVCARDVQAGQRLAKEFGARAIEPVDLEGTFFRVLVHTTPLGMGGRGLFLPPGLLGSGQMVLDAVYQPACTPLLELAQAVGATPVFGRDWLLAQARAQFELWNGLPTLPGSLARGLPVDTPVASVPTSIALVGMPAAGKTTLGRALAKDLGVPFVDLDESIAQSYAQQAGLDQALPVGQTLEAMGESAFRLLERDLALECLARPERQVLALGGGAVETQAVRAALRDAHPAYRVGWVHAPLAELLRRRELDGPTRPRLTSSPDLAGELRALFARRWPHYASLAHFGLAPVDWNSAVSDPIPGLCRRLQS